MSALDTRAPADLQDPDAPSTGRWHPMTTIAFRFGYAYLLAFCLLFAQITFVFAGFIAHLLPDNAIMWQMLAVEPIVAWVGRTIFGVDASLDVTSGSGDQAIIWLLVFTLLILAAVATAAWSALDRGREHHRRLWAWSATALRLFLGGQMLFYGFAKFLPSQMSPPSLTALLQPYGDFSPASVLWLQVGSSPIYEILLGSVEVLGGVLLFVPRTATLGALVSFVAMVQVLILNMTFDVPVKILSAHLVLIALVLLAPQMRNLFGLFVLQRPAAAVPPPQLFSRPRQKRIAAWVQVCLGIWVAIGAAYISWTGLHEYGARAPKPPLHGIWAVDDFRIEGRSSAPLTTDPTRWQRLVFDTDGAATVQMMDGALHMLPAHVDEASRSIEIPATPSTRLPSATVRFDRPTDDRLRLDGTIDGAPTTVTLHRVDPNAFPLRSRGFHWIQEQPYFR
ncbi:DoxX family protein [Gordonia sp. CPCC 206044]|uniref:DoxX family protein n=1 Tax=Gordonia sp. CPCC 206044 TaxID=3140793 RepID=UPI003AF3EF23